MPVVDMGVSACIIAVAAGFVLLAALAASSMSPAATSPAMAPVSAAAISDRKSFAIRWWEAFRLVLLLAIGPAPDRPGAGHGPDGLPGRDEGQASPRGRLGQDRDESETEILT